MTNRTAATDIVIEIRADLEEHLKSEGYTNLEVRRSYVPIWSIEEFDIGKIYVTVFEGPTIYEPGSRSQGVDVHTISIAVQKQFEYGGSLEETDEMRYLLAIIGERYRGHDVRIGQMQVRAQGVSYGSVNDPAMTFSMSAYFGSVDYEMLNRTRPIFDPDGYDLTFKTEYDGVEITGVSVPVTLVSRMAGPEHNATGTTSFTLSGLFGNTLLEKTRVRATAPEEVEHNGATLEFDEWVLEIDGASAATYQTPFDYEMFGDGVVTAHYTEPGGE